MGGAPSSPPHQACLLSVRDMSVEYLRQRGGDVWRRWWCGSRRTTAMGATTCKRLEPRASGSAARAPGDDGSLSLLRADRREQIERRKNKNAQSRAKGEHAILTPPPPTQSNLLVLYLLRVRGPAYTPSPRPRYLFGVGRASASGDRVLLSPQGREGARLLASGCS